MFESVAVQKEGDLAIVTLRGEFIGGEETDQLRDTLKQLPAEGVKKVIIDLGKVSYLNSTALGVLISAHATFTKANGKIVLANLTKGIENIFVITKLTLIFDIYRSIEEAKKALIEEKQSNQSEESDQ